MSTFLKKILSLDNSLLLYKYNIQGFLMENKKQIRNISGGLKITKNEDEDLRKLSALRGESKFMRGRMAYDVFVIGLNAIKKEFKEVYDEKEINHIINTVNTEEANQVLKIVETLKKHGLSLEVKPLKESKWSN